MQTYVVVMALLVVAGTLFDVMHKQSATYFFNSWRSFANKAKRQVGGGQMASLAVQTAVIEVMASGEFCNMRRRIAHLLTMYVHTVALRSPLRQMGDGKSAGVSHH